MYTKVFRYKVVSFYCQMSCEQQLSFSMSSPQMSYCKITIHWYLKIFFWIRMKIAYIFHWSILNIHKLKNIKRTSKDQFAMEMLRKVHNHPKRSKICKKAPPPNIPSYAPALCVRIKELCHPRGVGYFKSLCGFICYHIYMNTLFFIL